MATQKTLNGAAQFAATVFGDEDRTAAGVQISGTFTGTLVFEGSMDSGNTWVPVYGIPVVAGALTAPVNSATAPGNWLFQFGGWTTLRVRASAFSSGSAVVWIATNAGLSYQGAAASAGVTATLQSLAFDVPTTITRPANATPYTAGDVLGGALDLGVLSTAARAIMITSVQLEADVAALPAGQTSWELHLYSVTPPSAIADNSPWTGIPVGDRPSYLGFIPLPTLVAKGTVPATLYSELNGVNKQVLPVGTHLFGYLVTVGAFTPAGNSEVYKVTVHAEAV